MRGSDLGIWNWDTGMIGNWLVALELGSSIRRGGGCVSLAVKKKQRKLALRRTCM